MVAPSADVQEDVPAASEEVITEEHVAPIGGAAEKIETAETAASDDAHSEAEPVAQEDTSASDSNIQSQTDI